MWDLVPRLSNAKVIQRLWTFRYKKNYDGSFELNGFVLLSIEKELLNEINHNNLMNDFASKKVRKVKF
ncbi:hypothetical protein MTR_2g026280 [Medicago truncatula]|uniref:Uncharacterized protein n=1 Tax=Medicago truncatula TaxID=3880 RepID=G7IPA5_MEDTR|nr:hypothetical protein MTR_2g026280 [Medicago truncatula]